MTDSGFTLWAVLRRNPTADVLADDSAVAGFDARARGVQPTRV